jgi:nuclease-like protein
MARMIPPRYESTASAAEKRVFHLLEGDPATSDWFVLHSLGLSRRGSGPYGEIDFVVLVPSGGLVCLEIKGGRVSCKNGLWQTIDRFGATSELKKSPFMQAREGMFALLHSVQERFGNGSDASRCLFAYAVVFPDVDCPPQTPEFELWEAIDRNCLKTPISKLILNVLSGQRKKMGGFYPSGNLASTIRDVRQFLRPDFERILARAAVVSESESSLISLTEDQYEVLDMISDNPRCLIEGAAGTGKTVLALEYSRRQAAAGQKVLLVCFNRLLGEWFESCTNSTGVSGLAASSYFRFIRKLILDSTWKKEYETAEQTTSQDELFSELLPFYGQLAAEGLNPQFDTVVVDEAQDLLSSTILDLLGTLLKGGIAGGNWYFFGDFTRQCLYGNTTRDARLHALNSACANFSHTKLHTNCRNTRRIGEETALLSGFSSPPYKLGQVHGLSVDYRYWKNPQQQLEKLTDVIRGLLAEGMSPEDLVLLSGRKFSESVASQLECPTQTHGTVSAFEIRSGVAPLMKGSRVGFATIQSFKGMETSAAIVCDIQHVETDEPQALLYTGMSRARSLLVMMVHESVRQGIANSLMRKLNEGWKS